MALIFVLLQQAMYLNFVNVHFDLKAVSNFSAIKIVYTIKSVFEVLFRNNLAAITSVDGKIYVLEF